MGSQMPHQVSLEYGYYDMYGTEGFMYYLKSRGVTMYRYKVIASRSDCESDPVDYDTEN